MQLKVGEMICSAIGAGRSTLKLSLSLCDVVSTPKKVFASIERDIDVDDCAR